MSNDVLVMRYEKTIVNGLISRGRQVHLLLGPADDAVDSQVSGIAEVYRVESIDNVTELSCVAGDLLSRSISIDDVVSFREDTHYAADFIRIALGMHGPDRTSIRIRDKRLMKMYVSEFGVPCASFISLGGIGLYERAASFTETVGFPVVIKPTSSMGARGVSVIHNRHELSSAITDSHVHSKPWEYMLESFVAGEEYHFDGLWENGKPVQFVISRYLANRIDLHDTSDKNGSVSLPFKGNESLYEDGLNTQLRINQALGVNSGVTHFEYFWTGSEFIFSEGATRFSGGPVPGVVSKHTGIDWLDAFSSITLQAESDSSMADWKATTHYTGWVNLRLIDSAAVDTIENRLKDFDAQISLLGIDLRQYGAVVQDAGGDWRTAWGVAPIVSGNSYQRVLDSLEHICLVLAK